MADSSDIEAVQNASLDLVSLREKTYDTVTSFDYIDQPISYKDFFRNYLLPNKPCICGSWLTEKWRSRQEWVDNNGKPNFSLLQGKFGEAIAPIANCSKVEYSSHPKHEMTVTEFMNYWQQLIDSDHSSDHECFYLKDWHFTKAFPDYKAYSCPHYFSSDWMNEFWDTLDNGDDYRFVYMGPQGSWTPFHADVFRSYSWSANICGKKKWIFFPPGEEDKLRDRCGQLVFDLDSPELNDRGRFPHADDVTRRLEVIQEVGEVVFVPSGWHHQVFNLEDTISINHNWMNACNVDFAWTFLARSLDDVKKEIDDCREMEGWSEQCQLILKATVGINFSGFYKLLNTIASRRIKQLTSAETAHHSDGTETSQDVAAKKTWNEKSADIAKSDHPPVNKCGNSDKAFPHEYSIDSVNIHEIEGDPKYSSRAMNIHDLVFDLMRIKSVIEDMLTSDDFMQVDLSEFSESPKNLLLLIEQATEKHLQ